MKLLITIPCFNEELVLQKTVFSIMEYANNSLSSFDWKILIIDNNSSDSTFKIANSLRDRFVGKVIVRQEKAPGRGIAIRSVWSTLKDFDVYSYMDADLATDIKDFSFIVDEVKNGYDLVTGSRYVPYADVKRDVKRKILSRIYNFIIKIILKVSFKDAQCGFKAFSRRIVEDLIPKTKDDGWFWDTELMILAELEGFRILEVPVSWREVRDELRQSKVSHWSESVKQLRNIKKMRSKLASGFYGKKFI